MLNPFFDYPDPEPILRDAFWDENPFSGAGIFAQIAGEWGLVGSEHQGEFPPWYTEVPADILNREYFLNHSGGKFCSPLVKYYINKGYVDTNGVLNATATGAIARVIVSKYRNNWARLWETNVAAYSPVHNYDMYEERDLETTEDETIDTDGTIARSGTESTQYGRVETVGHGRTNEQMSYKYGINTATNDPKPSDKVENTEGGTTTTTLSGTDTDTRNLTDTTDETRTKDNDGTEHEEIHRYGNIGVTTTQKLLQEERQLWLWNYFDQIFSDLDKELALSFHDSCRV